jgi:site-specific recombinase XerD
MLSEIQRFIQSIRRHSPDARTWRDYTSDLKLFASVVGDVSPDSVSARDIDRFVAIQTERGFKPATINRRLGTVTSLYAFLSDDDDTLTCPVNPRRHHLREPQRLARPLSQDNLSRFFAVIHDHRDRAMFQVMLDCGLRIAEVAGLKMADVHLPRLVVRGKGSRERTVYVSPEASQALQTCLAERPSVESEFVFLSYLNNGMSTTAIHKRLMVYRQLSGVSLTAHRLRHSFASRLLASGVPVTSIQKLMGHRKLETTQGYMLIDDRRVRSDYDQACHRLNDWICEKGAGRRPPHRWTTSRWRSAPARRVRSM